MLVSSELWDAGFTSVYTTTEEGNGGLLIIPCSVFHFNIYGCPCIKMKHFCDVHDVQYGQQCAHVTDVRSKRL